MHNVQLPVCAINMPAAYSQCIDMGMHYTCRNNKINDCIMYVRICYIWRELVVAIPTKLNYFHDITRPALLVAKDESVFLERLRVLPVDWACLASAIACSSS